MYSLKDRVVFITGASSGIGRSCARAFALQDAKLLLAARRVDRLEELAAELKDKLQTQVHVFRLDVRDQPAVERAVKALPPEWATIEVLVNNAGLSRGLDKLHEGKLEDWEEMIDTNVKGLLYVSRAVIPAWWSAGGAMSSISGRSPATRSIPAATSIAPPNMPSRPCPSRCASTHGTGVRVSSVDPGLVETEFSLVRYRGDSEKAGKIYQGMTP